MITFLDQRKLIETVILSHLLIFLEVTELQSRKANFKHSETGLSLWHRLFVSSNCSSFMSPLLVSSLPAAMKPVLRIVRMVWEAFTIG